MSVNQCMPRRRKLRRIGHPLAGWRQASISLLLVVSSASAEQAPTAPGTEAEARAQAAAVDFSQRLRQQLMQAMQTGGALAAIEVCRVQAPLIAAELSQAHGLSIGRIGVRTRNPDNHGPAWSAAVLADFQQRAAAGEAVGQLVHSQRDAGSGEWHFARALSTEAPCLACHGSELAEPVQAALQRHYPQDQATGFAVGELRGLLWVEVPSQPPGSAR